MKFLSSLFLIATLATPVRADMFEYLTEGSLKRIDCEVRDRECLLNLTTDLILTYAKTREQAKNTGFASDLTKIYWMLPEDQRGGMRDKIRTEITRETAKVLEDFDYYLPRNEPVQPVTLADLDQVLRTETTPDGSKFGDYILDGFTHLMETDDREAAIEMWLGEHNLIIWQKGSRTYQFMQNWLAINDPQRFNEHTKSKNLAARHRQRMWEDKALIAARHCKLDDIQGGNLVLDPLLQQFADRSPKDIVIRMYAKAELFRAILECKPREDATDFLNDIMAMKPDAYAFIKEEYPTKREQDFVLSAAHDTVEIRTTRLLATKLIEEGDLTQARKVFEDGQATVGVFGFGATADGDLKLAPMQRQAMTWEAFTTYADEDRKYEAGTIAIPYLLDEYTFDMDNKYSADKDLGYFMEAVADVWPSELSKQGAARVMEHATALAAHNPDYARTPVRTMLTLGQNKQPPKCTYSDETLRGMLDAMPSFRYPENRNRTIIDYLRYLDRTAAAKDTDGKGECVLNPTP